MALQEAEPEDAEPAPAARAPVDRGSVERVSALPVRSGTLDGATLPRPLIEREFRDGLAGSAHRQDPAAPPGGRG